MLFEQLLQKIRVFRGSFFSVALRPQKASQVDLPSYVDKYNLNDKIGIIIQGGIWERYDFTLETVKLYHKNYPHAVVIISTWSDTPQEILNKFEQENIELVVSDKPFKRVSGNCDLQIISTYNAVVRAKSLGCNYVCKTRTDQRMYSTDIFSFLLKLQCAFPLSGEISTMNKRIIAIGSNTYRDRVYDINDMWLFGHVDDILAYWSCNPNMVWDEGCSLLESQKISETYICSEFLKKIGHHLEWTINDTLSILAKYFIIIDKQSIDLFAVKRINEYMNKHYSQKKGLIEVGFKDWINLLYEECSDSHPAIQK